MLPSPRLPIPPFTRETAAQKVRLAYEWRDDAGNWLRSYGNENWAFDDHGYMHRRFASINDMPIAASDRKFHWPQGRRPDAHPGLSELGL